jgi:hypothetical protein
MHPVCRVSMYLKFPNFLRRITEIVRLVLMLFKEAVSADQVI